MRGVAGQHLTGAWAAAPAPGDAVLERVATIGGPDAILRAISAMDDPPRYAITAEAAADRLAPFTRFARVELHVTDATPWDEALQLTPVARGGNVILIRPTDGGALDGSFERDGVTLASRPQLYVDLVRRGGAAAEAAAFLRERPGVRRSAAGWAPESGLRPCRDTVGARDPEGARDGPARQAEGRVPPRRHPRHPELPDQPRRDAHDRL